MENKARSRALEVKTLFAQATAKTGLADFGDTCFLTPFEQLIDSVNRKITFTESGRATFESAIIRLLTNRLRIQAEITRHPEILQEELPAPIIVFGLPRTGTTKLQRMLSAAPEVQKMYFWRILNPAPFPNAVSGEPDPRITALIPDAPLAGSPSEEDVIRAAHNWGIMEVEEEYLMMDFTLDMSIPGLNIFVPLFFHDQWAPGAAERDVDRNGYAYLRLLLQCLQWQDGGHRGRPWIMKSPSHATHLAALLETFPDATLVQCHRDPCVAVPSATKLLTEMWRVNTEFDVKAVGRQVYDLWRVGMQRCVWAREQLGLDERIIDVNYRDVRHNMMSVIKTIYQRNGRELTAPAKAAMLAWEQDNEQGKHGAHHYSLEEFGLDRAEVEQGFADYIERFSLYF